MKFSLKENLLKEHHFFVQCLLRMSCKFPNTQKQLLEVFYKKAIFKIPAIFIGKHLCWSLSLIKSQTFRPASLLKETPTQVFSCEYCKIFKNTCFEQHLRMAAPAQSLSACRKYTEAYVGLY